MSQRAAKARRETRPIRLLRGGDAARLLLEDPAGRPYRRSRTEHESRIRIPEKEERNRERLRLRAQLRTYASVSAEHGPREQRRRDGRFGGSPLPPPITEEAANPGRGEEPSKLSAEERAQEKDGGGWAGEREREGKGDAAAARRGAVEM
jgi:hypothetical protein